MSTNIIRLYGIPCFGMQPKLQILVSIPKHQAVLWQKAGLPEDPEVKVFTFLGGDIDLDKLHDTTRYTVEKALEGLIHEQTANRCRIDSLADRIFVTENVWFMPIMMRITPRPSQTMHQHLWITRLQMTAGMKYRAADESVRQAGEKAFDFFENQ